MKQRKYISKQTGYTMYEVHFLSSENENFRDERPTTHVATIFCSGTWYYCIQIDGKPANSLAYASPKAAAANAWLVKTDLLRSTLSSIFA